MGEAAGGVRGGGNGQNKSCKCYCVVLCCRYMVNQQNDSWDETWKHILRVRELLYIIQNKLQDRGVIHDISKLIPPEKEGFDAVTGALRGLTYGGDEYKAQLEKLKPTLDHHYANNSHHTEFHKNGIDGMTLIDIIEMFCDWRAATERHADGNFEKSILHNKTRFAMSEQLFNIFENTRKHLKW